MKGGRMSNTPILALDLGTRTGWARLHADGTITSGSISHHPRSGEGPGARFVRFRRFLSDFTADGFGGAVYWEDVRRHVATDAAHAYGGYLAIMLAWAESANLRYLGNGLSVGQIKKLATGNGAAKKPEMIAWAKSQGFRPRDDNEADALAILKLAIARESGTAPSTAKKTTAKKPRTAAPEVAQRPLI